MAETLDSSQMLLLEEPQKYFNSLKPFWDLITYNRCALMEVETKLKVLYEEFNNQHQRNPFESIKTRIKSVMSILEKLNRKGLPLTLESIENNLNDIAGVRVICSFPEDIYVVANLLASQDDIRVLETRDYIKNPKPNGYRSLHQILDIPIFLSTEKKYMRVEVQYRTIAMDFWASLDHKMKYKRHIDNTEYITEELRKCAEIISETDERMQAIRHMIDSHTPPDDSNMAAVDSWPAGSLLYGSDLDGTPADEPDPEPAAGNTNRVSPQ